jgi:hypothetical protein
VSGGLSADAAIDALLKDPGAFGSRESLRELARQVSVDSPGRVTVLYSGDVANRVSSWSIVKAMEAAGEDVRIIDRSEAAKFLSSDEFLQATARAHGVQVTDIEKRTDVGRAANAWLFDAERGPWADASARFAEQTRGEVKLLVNGANPERVFGATELPRILANPNVTTIEGIPRETLVARQASHGTQAAFDMAVARAHENAGLIRTAVNAQGLPLRGDDGHLQLDNRQYFQGTTIEGKAPTGTAMSRPLADLMGPPNAHALAGQQHLDELARAAAQDMRPAASPRMTRLGAAATGLGAALTVADGGESGQRAASLYEQGNATGAQSELIHFTTRNVGAWGGAALGAGLGAASTSWSGPGAVIGGIVGGAAGLVGGEKVADYLDHRRIYRQDDADGKTWAFDPEKPAHGWRRTETIEQVAANGRVVEQSREVVASGPLAAQLDRQATTVSLELMLARPPVPKDPYTLPSGPGDATSIPASSWQRDPATGDWTRRVYEWRDDGTDLGRSELRETITADATRAAQLEAASQAILRENVHLAPAAMAARFELAHRDKGWDRIGPLPDSAQQALRDDGRLVASDGAEYQRQAGGGWQRQALFGMTTADASPKIASELDAARGLLQEGLREHRALMAERPQPAPPTFEQTMADAVTRAYAREGLTRPADEVQAMAQAMVLDHRARGLDGPYMVQLERDPATKQYGPESPMGLYTRGADGDMALRFTMTPAEARELLARPPSPAVAPTPEPASPAAPKPVSAVPNDPLNEAMRGHVQAMDRAMGRTPDEASDRVAAALTAEWRANGLTSRPDGVVLGQKGGSAQPGEYVFAYSGSSERPSDWVGVRTAEAVQTPVEQSLAKAETLQRQQTMEAQQMAQAQQQANDAPVRSMS